MKRTVISFLGFLALWTLALYMVMVAARAQTNTDDVQLRSYNGGWFVLTDVPALGDEPVPSIYQAPPGGGSTDYYRIGAYLETVEWGAGPGGKPVVTVTLGGAK